MDIAGINSASAPMSDVAYIHQRPKSIGGPAMHDRRDS
jgi:hypothetical protein